MCVFCNIVKSEISSHKIYEDESTLAFLDVSPINYGHVLVIPKEHFENMETIPEEELCKLMKTVKKVGAALKSNLGAEGYNIQENNDLVAGQVVPHIHFHVIPRNEGDGLKLWPGGRYGDGEAEQMAEKLKINL